ncbi:hypothetical protein [Streptomyces cyaneofuscatus]|uniref:hypothetical protein n=1 Tax=Streptomyces cyaneofuscatus TaxID=66883 RepID=UPI0013D8ED88|nr:hypothetical protein [Streptomyces cyaneofuscatus]NDZ63575.1 hypothetical protein [Streptomyces cyaneofuscatus]
MARIQVLELPTIHRENGTYETPFVLIVDHVTQQEADSLAHRVKGLSERCGARTAVISEIPLDVVSPSALDVQSDFVDEYANPGIIGTTPSP